MNIVNGHNLRINGFPKHWLDGLPLGNGKVGVMLWGNSKTLNLSLDHANAWDTRSIENEYDDPLYNYQSLRQLVKEGRWEDINNTLRMNWKKNNPLGPTKINLGRLEIEHDAFSDANFELSIDDAIVTANLKNKQLESDFEIFVSKSTNSIVVNIDKFPSKSKLNYIPFYECCEEYKILNNPEVEISESSKNTVILQHILPDKYFAICYFRNDKELYVSFAYSQFAESAKTQAHKNNTAALKTGYESLKQTHLNNWRQFWSKSSVSIPEKEYENLWYFGLYLLNSSAAKGMYPPGLQGLWATDGFPACWRGDFHSDLNIQQTFAMTCGANHIELLDVWLDYICSTVDKAREFTRRFFDSKGAFQVCSTVPGHIPVTGSCPPVQLAWSHTGWLAQLAWQRWRYTMDKEWLKEKGYPFVSACFGFYAENLELENDGKYHIPLSSSPEYNYDRLSAWQKDPNIDIALIRKCCDWILEMEEALEIKQFSSVARNIKSKLVKYHIIAYENSDFVISCQKVLGLWADKLLDESHRHPSHLMAIYPAMDITIDGGKDEKQIIDDSLNHFLSLGQYMWCGHAYIQMISLAAVTGKGDLAYSFLQKYFQNWTLQNLLHHNTDKSHESAFRGKREHLMTMETSCGVVEGIDNMFLQSWNGIIRVFPALPPHWKDVSFINLLTEGGFEVSASMREKQIKEITIKGKPGRLCRIKNCFQNRTIKINNIKRHEASDILEIEISEKGLVKINID